MSRSAPAGGRHAIEFVAGEARRYWLAASFASQKSLFLAPESTFEAAGGFQIAQKGRFYAIFECRKGLQPNGYVPEQLLN